MISSLVSYESQVKMEIIFFYITVVLLSTALIWLLLVGLRVNEENNLVEVKFSLFFAVLVRGEQTWEGSGQV
jgi:hypothetical protein